MLVPIIWCGFFFTVDVYPATRSGFDRLSEYFLSLSSVGGTVVMGSGDSPGSAGLGVSTPTWYKLL